MTIPRPSLNTERGFGPLSPTPSVDGKTQTAEPVEAQSSVSESLQDDPCYFCQQGELKRKELQRKESK